MNSKLITAGLIVAALFAPIAVRAQDGDADRAQPGVFVKDSIITTKIKTKLAGEKLSSLMQVRVDTDRNGAVVLSGHARSQQAIDKAVILAKATEGVTSVKNSVMVKKDD